MEGLVAWAEVGRVSLGRVFAVFAVTVLWLLTPPAGRGYSVQTHEQIIDLAWRGSIVPLLKRRFPQVTEADLEQAHAYAYGGSAIQDIGYYPFGNEFFSDLTHYVRSGDFVTSLLRNARTPQELAFAVGALSHYLGDTIGHSQAVNPSVGIEFPNLERKYGPVVVYDENPHAHVRTEFAFDINQISKRRFAPSRYLAHVGLKVSGDLLERAVAETYGLTLRDALGRERRVAIRGYRFSVRGFLPRIAYAETVLHRSSFLPDTPGPELDRLMQELAQSEFENGWDQYRKHPGIGTYSLAGLIFILPKVGALSDLAIRGPNTATEALYVASVNQTVDMLRKTTNTMDGKIVSIANRDLDTGAVVRPGGYRLTDRTYARLLGVITRTPAAKVPAGLKRDIESYYADPGAPISTKQHPERWARVQADLEVLGKMETRAEP